MADGNSIVTNKSRISDDDERRKRRNCREKLEKVAGEVTGKDVVAGEDEQSPEKLSERW